MNYSINELQQITNAIESVLSRSKQEKYNRRLVYGLNKNLRKLQCELEDLNKQLEELPAEFNEYRQKLYDSAVKHGAKPQQLPDGSSTINMNVEGFNQQAFNEESETLKEEYKEIIEETDNVLQKNKEIKADRIADIVWYNISIDHFPETLSYEDLPFQLTDMIED